MKWNGMNRYPLRQVSSKQRVELEKRRVLKAQLIAEQIEERGHSYCKHCGKRPDFRGLQLVHLKRLSQGGKTAKDNCEIWCAPCHFGVDGHKTEV